MHLGIDLKLKMHSKECIRRACIWLSRNPQTNSIIMKTTSILIASLLTIGSAQATIIAQYDFDGADFGTNFTNPFASTDMNISNQSGVGGLANSSSTSQNATYLWNGQSLGTTQDWVLSISAGATQSLENQILSSGSGDEASIGLLAAFTPGGGGFNALLFEFYIENDFPVRGIATTSLIGASQTGAFASNTGLSAELRLSFKADTKMLEALAPNGDVVQSVNVQTQWGMDDTSTFQFGITGGVENINLPNSSSIWVDNLQLETIPEPSSVMLLALSAVSFVLRRKR